MIYKNIHHCGLRIWRKFSWVGKTVYNEVYGTMIKNQLLFRHRGKSVTVALLDKIDWEVTCHNAAYTAARAAEKTAERLAA